MAEHETTALSVILDELQPIDVAISETTDFRIHVQHSIDAVGAHTRHAGKQLFRNRLGDPWGHESNALLS